MTYRALLVTKDDQAVNVLAPLLQDSGLRVQCCGYSDAVCLVTEQRFQAVLVDFDDPHSAALVLQNTTSVSENRPLTVALLRDKNRVRNVFGAGANFVLYKPLSREQAQATLRAATALIKNERRSSSRVAVQVAVKMRVENGENPAEFDGILLDLSDSGMDVLAAQSLYPSARVRMRFTLSGRPAEFDVAGEVVWANPNGESGVRFRNTPESVLAALRAWLRENSQAAQPPEPQAVADCKLTDLSLGGCYIETASPFPEHAQVALTLMADGMELQGRGLVRVMHPSRGMGIEFAAGACDARGETASFIQFLASRPGVTPRLTVAPCLIEAEPEAYGGQDAELADPLLDLLRNHESFSEEMFLEELHGQRGAEFVQK
jgi:DNA-binding response OmpR family regulator